VELVEDGGERNREGGRRPVCMLQAGGPHVTACVVGAQGSRGRQVKVKAWGAFVTQIAHVIACFTVDFRAWAF